MVAAILVNGPLSQARDRTPSYWDAGAGTKFAAYLQTGANVDRMVIFFALSNLIFMFAILRNRPRDKRPVDACASNMGHCLWSGIVDAHKAQQVADRLMSPEMFSGWGVRTLATDMGAYNPVSYHNGARSGPMTTRS